jgi:hypothetical protein
MIVICFTFMLRPRHLEAAGAADCGVRHVAVPCDLIRGVNDDDPFSDVIGEYAGNFPQHGGLAHAGAAKQQNRVPRAHEVVDQLDAAEHGAADAAGQTHGLTRAVAQHGNPVERSLDSRPVVIPELAYPLYNVLNVVVRDLSVTDQRLTEEISDLGQPAEVEDDLGQVAAVGSVSEEILHAIWQDLRERVEVVYDPGRNALHANCAVCRYRASSCVLADCSRNSTRFRHAHRKCLNHNRVGPHRTETDLNEQFRHFFFAGREQGRCRPVFHFHSGR